MPARDILALAGVLVAMLPALLPLTQPGLAATHDGFLHVQRLIAIEAAARQGGPFLRWLPDLAYGYGQPLLLYYAPLSYVPALLAQLFGVGYVASFEVASGLALLLSALAMYLFARSLCGPLGASVAAIVYATLPYQMVDLYVRGALAESWAFVWLPLSAWCLMRAWTDRRPRWSVWLALTVAALILTHNVTALLFLPALFVLAVLLQVNAGGSWRNVPMRPMVALGAGLLLSAWFWLPALAERDLVQIGETLEPALFASFVVRTWPPFRLDALYDYQQPVSTALGSPIFWPQLGLVQAVITAVGAAAAWGATGQRRVVAVWALVLVAGSYALQLAPLAALYDAVPLLAFVQFPWRLLTLLGLGSALLAGLLIERFRATLPMRLAVAGLVVTASVVTAVARLDPETVPVEDRLLSVESIMRAELAEYGLGTTHSGEYLPVSSGQRNAARIRKTLLDAGGGAAQQNPAPSLPPTSVQIQAVRWRADRITLDVEAPTADRLLLHQFAFPGWVARIDGEPHPLTAAGPLGVLALDVPAGTHQIEVSWEWTPLRMVASSVSVLSVMLLVLLGSAVPRRPEPRRILLGLAVMGLIVSLVNPAERGRPGESDTVPIATRSAAQPDTDPLLLLDTHHDLSRLADERVAVTRLIWQVRQPPAVGYRAGVEVTAANGATHRAPWIYEPLSRVWERGEIVQTVTAIRLPPEFPVGLANLSLVFDRPAGQGPVPLGTLDVPALDVPAITGLSRTDASAHEIPVGETLRLGSSDLEAVPALVRAGGSFDVAVRWRATSLMPDVSREFLVVAVLGAPDGDIVSEARRPGDWFMPQPFWQAGDVVEQRLRLAVPPAVPAGSYPFSVRVYPRDLARGGMSEPGASEARLRGQPVAELVLGDVTVTVTP